MGRERAAMPTQPLVFKVADEAMEFEQIHRLNYRTFVDEIPQHAPNLERMLVDKFHPENTYLICRQGERVAGMVAVRDKRPFSLDGKLDQLDAYLPPHHSVCEIRLLAIEQDRRSPQVFRGIMLLLARHVEAQGYDLAVMSGTTRQLRLYRGLGFAPFGPLVGTAGAEFQPMYMTLAAFIDLKEKSLAFARR
jgi:hypothetical protein